MHSTSESDPIVSDSALLSPPVATPDEPVRRYRGQRRRHRLHGAIAHLEREQTIARGGIRGTRVHLGEVDRDMPGLSVPKGRDERLGPRAALLFGAGLAHI